MANAVILSELISKLEISIAEFERKIGVTASMISAAIRRKTKIKQNVVDKIATAYPDVNKEWLETGDGEMFIQKITETSTVKKPEENGENSGTGEKPHIIPSGEQGKKSPKNTTPMEIEQRSMIKDLVRQNLLLTEAHKDLTEAHKELVKLLSNSEGNGSKEQAA